MEGTMIMEANQPVNCFKKDLQDLTVNSESSAEDVAKEIAECLSETNGMLVFEVVTRLGISKAIDIYSKVQNIESNGGLLTSDGTRKRTPGGVFFHLITQDAQIETRVKKEIFQNTSKTQRLLKVQAMKEKRRKKNKELKELMMKEGLLMLKNLEN